jgi:hypothetical protein
MLKNIGRNNQLYMLANFLFAFGTGLWLNLRPLYLADLGAAPKQIGLPTYPSAYDQFLIVVGLVFNILTLWYAWKWSTRKEAQDDADKYCNPDPERYHKDDRNHDGPKIQKA